MQQHLTRVATEDGTGIAVATVGDGRRILFVSGWLSHLELGWQLPEERAFDEALARGARLVRYDRAGCGLSDRTDRPPSLEFELEQVDAVARGLGLDRFDLVGASLGAPVAVAWAAAHPDTVRRLVLYGGWAHGEAISPPSAREHILALVASHWGLGSDVLTDLFAPDASAVARAQLASYQRASSDAGTARALLELSYRMDVRALLPQVAAPTLVVHRADDRAAPVAEAEALAAGIPDARLTVLPGRSHLPWAGDSAELVAVIRRFLGLRVARTESGMLTPRQREVAALVGAGLTNREIAARLGIEERSAEGHVERIRLRLGVRSRAQIAAWDAAQR
ncbi:alpha/beta fold hydrolase [Leifsonia sp. NPDC077715]|uniref:alpha/beta fold hydrolase n=1 Tax=Leifsonia sp. NPDC077715 TaxID=3155539 RepID=UPI00342C484A